MKVDKITLISIIAIILVFCIATVFAVSTLGNDTKMICVNKDGYCFINSTGDVIANNSTDNGNMLILEDDGERTIFAFFEIPGDNPSIFNGFIYNDGKPCYAYKMNDKYYCISIVKSSDSSHMTTEYLQKVLVLSNQWSQDVNVDNPVETDYIGEGLSLYDLYLGIWLQKIDIMSYNILFLGLYHKIDLLHHPHNHDPSVNQGEVATADNGVIDLLSKSNETNINSTNNSLENGSNLTNENGLNIGGFNNESQNSVQSPILSMFAGNTNSSVNSSLDNNSEKASGGIFSIGNNKKNYASDVKTGMDEQSKLLNKFDSDANNAEVSSSNEVSTSNSAADTSSSQSPSSSSSSQSSTTSETTSSNESTSKTSSGLTASATSTPSSSSKDKVVVNIKLPSDAKGKVVVKVDGKSKTISSTTSNVEITVPTKSSHSVTVTFKGDSKYTSATTSTTA